MDKVQYFPATNARKNQVVKSQSLESEISDLARTAVSLNVSDVMWLIMFRLQQGSADVTLSHQIPMATCTSASEKVVCDGWAVISNV
jgi:hypothetical protein